MKPRPHLGAVDVDFDAGVLTIRKTKFHKSRLVPYTRRLSHSQDYVVTVTAVIDSRGTRHSSSRTLGLRLPYSTVRQDGWTNCSTGPCRVLHQWPRTAALPRLAAHVCVPLPDGLVSRRD